MIVDDQKIRGERHPFPQEDKENRVPCNHHARHEEEEEIVKEDEKRNVPSREEIGSITEGVDRNDGRKEGDHAKKECREPVSIQRDGAEQIRLLKLDLERSAGNKELEGHNDSCE